MSQKFFSLKSRLGQQTTKNYKYDVLAPIELQMEKEQINPIQGGGHGHHQNDFVLKAINRTRPDARKRERFQNIKSINKDSLDAGDVGHGMISFYNQKYKFEDSLSIKPKLCVCITMYNEKRNELEASLEGILRNMKHFKKSLNIENEEIMVVVVYDGIDKINNDKDPDDNMIQYFELWDRTEGKKYNKTSFTIPKKYQKFKEQVERSKYQVEELKKDEFKIFKTNEKLNDEFNEYMKSISKDERSIEAKKADFLYQVKNRAQKYIDSKANNAIVISNSYRFKRLIKYY